MMNENPVSLWLNMWDAQILHDAERHAEYLKKFKPGCFKHISPVSDATWNLRKCGGGIPQGKWDEMAGGFLSRYLNC